MTEQKTDSVVETRAELTKKQIYDRLSEQWDFEAIIEPYRDGGTQERPVTRTWGIVIDWLHVKKRYPLEIIGPAILFVMQRIKAEGPFKGNGTYGSAGDQFDQALRATCDGLMRDQLKKEVIQRIGTMKGKAMGVFIQGVAFSSVPWFIKMFTANYWRYRKARKQSGTTQRN